MARRGPDGGLTCHRPGQGQHIAAECLGSIKLLHERLHVHRNITVFPHFPLLAIREFGESKMEPEDLHGDLRVVRPQHPYRQQGFRLKCRDHIAVKKASYISRLRGPGGGRRAVNEGIEHQRATRIADLLPKHAYIVGFELPARQIANGTVQNVDGVIAAIFDVEEEGLEPLHGTGE